MSLPHAILTALLEKPGSGAELARRFDKSIGYFWQATHQQIYRELARLEGGGLIRSSARDSSRGRKKDYLVLPAGRAELARWTGVQQDPQPVRDGLMVRLRAMAVLREASLLDGTVRTELERHRNLHLQQLALYRNAEARDFPALGSGMPPAADPTGATAEQGEAPDRGLQCAVLRAGIMFEQAWVAWAEETLEALEP